MWGGCWWWWVGCGVWLCFPRLSPPRATAARARREGGTSLLPVGIVDVLGAQVITNRLWMAAVVVAVAALLTILVLLVRRIQKRVVAIKATLAQAEANTADGALLDTTAAGVDLVLAEGLEHHLFLGRVLGKVRS